MSGVSTAQLAEIKGGSDVRADQGISLLARALEHQSSRAQQALLRRKLAALERGG